MFTYKHRVQFYETDLMGIVHHTNYLRFCEEARVAWAHSVGLIDYQKPHSASQFAVYETRVKHYKPALFGQDLEIDLEVKRHGIRICFQYRVRLGASVLAFVQTTHVPMGEDLKITKMPESMKKILEGESWTEIWP